MQAQALGHRPGGIPARVASTTGIHLHSVVPLNSTRFAFNAVVSPGAPPVYRNVGDVQELERAQFLGYWSAADGKFTAREFEGDTQFGTDENEIRNWSHPMRRESGYPFLVKADISGLPVRFITGSFGKFHPDGPDSGVLYPDTTLGLGVVGKIPLDRIKTVTMMRGGRSGDWVFRSWAEFVAQRQGNWSQWRRDNKVAVLDLENVISVAESIVENHGLEGRIWYVPPGNYQDPEVVEGRREVTEFVDRVLSSAGKPDYRIRVIPNGWHLRDGGQGMTDGMNWIEIGKNETNDLTLLHECAHIIMGTHEGNGHTMVFAAIARDLYTKFLGPKAGQIFWDLVTASSASKEGTMQARASRHLPGGIPVRVAFRQETRTLWHITSRRDFKPSIRIKPFSPKHWLNPEPLLFATTDLSYWHNVTGGDEGAWTTGRKWAAELDVSAHPPIPQENPQQPESLLDPSMVKVKRIIPIEEAIAEQIGKTSAIKQAEANTSGVMVCLVPEESASQTLIEASDATEEIEEQHITLLYLGSVEEAGGDTGREKLHRAVYDFAINSGHDVLSGKANGWGVFNNPDEKVLVALWDIPNIAEFRAALKTSCQTHGVPLRIENHGFTPHSTMRYEDEPITTLPDPVDPQPTSTFTHVVIAWGDEDWVSVALGSLDKTADFDEGKHPRGGDAKNKGEFSKAPGSGAKPSKTEPSPVPGEAPSDLIADSDVPVKKKKKRQEDIEPKVLAKMKEQGDLYGEFLPAGKFEEGDPRNDPVFEEKEAQKTELSAKYSDPDKKARDKKIGGNTLDLHDHLQDDETGAMDWYDEDRHKLHVKIINDLLARAKDIPHEGKCLILAGPSGAGKSTFLTNKGSELGVEGGNKPTNYITINPDDFKDLLPADASRYPGLDANELAGVKHEESSYLAQEAAEELLATGVNVIMDIAMSSAPSAMRKYVTGHEDKYTYQVALVDGDMKNSLNNAGNRWKQTDDDTGDRTWSGRFVPMSLVLKQKPTKPGYRSVNAQAYVEFLSMMHAKRAVVYDPYDKEGRLQDAKKAVHEAIRQGWVLSGILRVEGDKMKDTTEITEKIQAHRRGEISDDALVQYLAHDAKYKATPENPYETSDPKWWAWSTDEKQFTPGSFAEVTRAKNRGLLDPDLYERVLGVFYSRQN